MSVEADVGALFAKRDWTMLSHRVIFHGRRTCHARRPACGACPVAAPLPVVRRSGETDPVRAAKLVKDPAGAEPGSSPLGQRRKRPVSARAELPDSGLPDLPGWFGPLLHVARTARAEDISAFVPPPGHHRRSAVLLLFGEGPAGPDVLLTERAAGLRAHPGQVAFPGGADRALGRRPRRGRRSARPGRRRASTPAGSWSSKPCPTSTSR